MARDQIAPKAVNLFHWEKSSLQKTTLGGIISTLIKLYVLWSIFDQGYMMLFKENAALSTIAIKHEQHERKVHVDQTPILAFSLLDYTYVPQEIDKTKLHVWVEKVTMEPNSAGKMEEKHDRFEVVKCNEEMLNT